MIKSALLGVVVAVAACAATAASAEIVFQGTMVTTQAVNCVNHAVGDVAQVNFHPKLPTQTDPSEGFSINIRQYELVSYRVPHGFGPAFQAVTDVAMTKNGVTLVWKGSKIKLTRSPAAISDATRYLRLGGQITKPENDPGTAGGACTISFVTSLIRQSN